MNLKFRVSVWLLWYLKTVWGALNPVVFIPGDGGSQMDAKLNKTSVVHYICEKTTDDFFNIWLNMELLMPLVIDCWVDNVRLVYDNQTRKTSNSPGVTIRIPGFGNSETVEWIDPSHASTGAYFNSIGDMLVKHGYVRNVSIKGAPYDFRKGPNENQEYFVRLKALIESTVHVNNNQSAMLIAHSMGGPMALYFLSLQTEEWKTKYIKSLVSISGAWGGSVKAIKVYAIGDDLGSYVLRDKVMKWEEITSPSLAWLLPSKHYWKPDEVLVETNGKNYSLANLHEFFIDVEIPNGWEMKLDMNPYDVGEMVPGVEVHCLYGTDLQTVEKLHYKKGTLSNGDPTLIYGDGDGTVNRRSLEGCLGWEGKQKQKVNHKVIHGAEHLQILHNPEVLDYIAGLLGLVHHGAPSNATKKDSSKDSKSIKYRWAHLFNEV